MRNLLQFIYRFHAFFLFALMEIFCFVLIYRYNHYQRTTFINSTDAISANIYSRYNSFTDYLHLRTVNDSLKKENARLMQYLPRSEYNKIVRIDTVKKMNPDSTVQMFRYIAADVISNSIVRGNNFITINRGSSQGIHKDMGVIGNGVVGVVRDVSQHFSTVISLLHRDFHPSAKLTKQGNRGYIMWTGIDPSVAQLMDIPNSVQLEKGDPVITSGKSAIFPEGIPIGTVKDFRLKAGSTFYDIDIDLTTDFRKLDHVYIVVADSAMKSELDALENHVENDQQYHQ